MFSHSKGDRKIELFVFDAFIAILKIKKVASKFDNAQSLLHSFTDWDSVIREFEIAGEASKHLLQNKFLNKSYQEVVDFRNHITHQYFGIDADIVWAIIGNDLHDFEQALIQLIENMKPELKRELITAFIEDNRYLDFVVQTLTEIDQ
ncbi:HepT-like ribonuclease domain-containing protein [Chrysiogenes arsenatis]|uniref:HepT-like ribonuclease domain-containing protein n=1 Tax=Chrysiogenes arsenatis TaxID=309797 RepID=UPI0003FB0A83|nr:HepT-like ribonuclease domain-containing protein [Chrysiogenes arsenatis]